MDKFSGLIYGISTVQDGNMSFRWGEKLQVIEDREKFLKKIGIDVKDTIVMKSEENWTDIMVVGNEDKTRGVYKIDETRGCGVLITRQKNLCLFLLIADCFPAVVYDAKLGILAMVHLGRQGVDGQLPKLVMKEFISMGSYPENIRVIVGPGIQKVSYTWTGKLPVDANKWGEFVGKTCKNKWLIDNIGFLRSQFIEIGVLEENIKISNVDVRTNSNYFSHARSCASGEKEGRFAMVAMMTNP